MFKIRTVIISIIFNVLAANAQTPISDADAKKVGFKKVVKYLKNVDLRYFSEIQPSINENSDLSAFHFHSAIYTVNAPVERVWNTCLWGSPANLWKGKTLGLGCVYSNGSDKIYYRDHSYFEKPELNQIYFLNINILRLSNIAAALIITDINYNENSIEFTYIKGNKAIGKQTLRLISRGANETQIIHDTYYKSSSKFRDKRLYPIFHQKAISDLHKMIDKYATAEKMALL